MPSDNLSRVKITHLKKWGRNIVSFFTERPEKFSFKSGQFVRICPESNLTLNTNPVWRAQSIASSPDDKFLEFLVVFGKTGDFSQLSANLKPGDYFLLEKNNYGYLTLDRFSKEGDLWLIASGTGLAPFLSIIRDFSTLNKFNRVNLIHTVRNKDNLVYHNEIMQLKLAPNFFENKNKITYLPVVTREIVDVVGLIQGRKFEYISSGEHITSLLKSGKLETVTNCKFTTKESKVMICGNPQMIKETRSHLKEIGFVTSKRNTPGQIAVENYW